MFSQVFIKSYNPISVVRFLTLICLFSTFPALSIANDNTNKLNEDLYWASFRGDDKKVTDLLNKGANAKFEIYEGKTSLHAAVIAHDGSIESNKKLTGRRPFSLPESGLAQRKLNIVKLLVKYGANVNKTDINGFTPLHLANTVEIADFLIKNGADVHAIARGGGNFSTPLSNCATHHISICKLLLKAGATDDIWAKEVGAISPLIMAVNSYNFEFAKLLIETGTYVNYQTDNGSSALEEALYNNARREQIFDYDQSREIIKLLVNNGAILNEDSLTGRNELDIVAESADSELVEFFIAKGKNVNALNRDKRTALFQVVTNYNRNPKKFMPIIKLLVKHGADMNVQGIKNWYSSHLLFHVRDLELLKYMIKNGADFRVKDEEGRGAEYFFKNQPELFNYLKTIN